MTTPIGATCGGVTVLIGDKCGLKTPIDATRGATNPISDIWER